MADNVFSAEVEQSEELYGGSVFVEPERSESETVVVPVFPAGYAESE